MPDDFSRDTAHDGVGVVQTVESSLGGEGILTKTAKGLFFTEEKLRATITERIDKETELTITEAAHRMFIYKYRLVTTAVERTDHEKFAAGWKPHLVQQSCSRPETRGDFLVHGVTLRYSYFDKDKRHIATIDVTPKDCSDAPQR